MTTNKETMVNAVIKNYMEINQLVKILNTRIKVRAINSYCSDLYRSCEEVANDICELLERKNILQNLMSALNTAISTFQQNERDVFDLRYIKHEKINTISEKTGLSKQTVFRTIHLIPQKIAKALHKDTFFDKFCKNDYQKIAFIENAYIHCGIKDCSIA
jgi:DNA-directed RNA polymerase specialized sigma subunit